MDCLGGTLRHISHGFVGSLAGAALERQSFDRVFLGTDGVTAERGLRSRAGREVVTTNAALVTELLETNKVVGVDLATRRLKTSHRQTVVDAGQGV